MNINDAKEWPPGSLMMYNRKWDTEQPHVGIGLVIANNGTQITVLWDSLCYHQMRTYTASTLNGRVISRILRT